jgi:DNA-binding GntR family transcriptional regulator
MSDQLSAISTQSNVSAVAPGKDGGRTPLRLTGDGRSLAERVTSTLRNAILNGYFALGEKIDVERISKDLGVSRIPVREALRRLEAERLVRNKAHYGATVTTVSRQDIREIYAVRLLLEVEMVRTIADRVPDTVLAELDQFLDEQYARLQAGDVSQRFMSDAYLHQRLLDFVENSLLKEVLESLNHRVGLVRFIANLQPGPHEFEPILEHKAIIQALRQRDGEAAAAKMREHLEKSAIRVQYLPWVEP